MYEVHAKRKGSWDKVADALDREEAVDRAEQEACSMVVSPSGDVIYCWGKDEEVEP